MKCTEMEVRAIAYLDGKLDRKEAAAVKQHLAECAACSERIEAFAGVGSLLDAWEPIAPSASFNTRLQQRILSEEAVRVGWRERLSLWFRLHPVGSPAMAGALLGIVLFAVVLTGYHPGAATVGAQTTASTQTVSATVDSGDELALYQDLPVLENLDLLRNFDVLQDLPTTQQ
jgi:anti-sigma factor RsiW